MRLIATTHPVATRHLLHLLTFVATTSRSQIASAAQDLDVLPEHVLVLVAIIEEHMVHVIGEYGMDDPFEELPSTHTQSTPEYGTRTGSQRRDEECG